MKIWNWKRVCRTARRLQHIIRDELGEPVRLGLCQKAVAAGFGRPNIDSLRRTGEGQRLAWNGGRVLVCMVQSGVLVDVRTAARVVDRLEEAIPGLNLAAFEGVLDASPRRIGPSDPAWEPKRFLRPRELAVQRAGDLAT